MKIFTETERRTIEKMITQASRGSKFEGAKPEFFIPADAGNVEVIRHTPGKQYVDCSLIINGLFRLGGHGLN
ncbi:MAG TPA: hypothetical protein VGO57_08535 [Verrucomicrobiae bacterium]|jgi:hypothetical protein